MKNAIARLLLGAVLAAAPVTAQTPPHASAGREVEVEPLNCWWRTDTAAVEVGERFTLTLTCSVVEIDRNAVVVDPSQLEPGALSLAPFEVVGGTRHEDVAAPPRRYFQYEYTVRIVGSTFFGLDVEIPSISVKYNIVSKIGGTEGRDQIYVLPALPMRVISLVPSKATDIRDISRETFADREARRRRATEELVAAAVAGAFAIVLLGVALARLVSRYRKKVPVGSRPLPPVTLLAACLRAVRRLQSEIAREGWTHDRVASACAIFRVAAAVALGETVAQSPTERDAPVHEGQVPLRSGVFRARRALISAATSAETIERALANPAVGRRAGAVAGVLGDVHRVLQVFSTTRYGRNAVLDAASLETALDDGTRAIRRLRWMNVWPMRMAGPLVGAAAAVVAGAPWLR